MHQTRSFVYVCVKRLPARIFVALLAPLIVASSAGGQTFTVLHSFSGGVDGSSPVAGLSIDRSGNNLYGTASVGGKSCFPSGCGTVFQLLHSASGWSFTPIYQFTGASDGSVPYGRTVLGPDGSLYGITTGGGSQACPGGCGVVYNLKPPVTVACKTAFCPWNESVLYSFQGSPDGFNAAGDVIFDAMGNLYGTTSQGGSVGPGIVYELTHSGNGWTESILYSLTGQSDGGNPYSGVIFDSAGNLYGTTSAGGINSNGAVFQLKPSGGGWVENTVHDFQRNSNDGGAPHAGLIMDMSGSFYGATERGGTSDGGTVYKVTPSGSGWTTTTLFSFPQGMGSAGPGATLVMDGHGNLYGTTEGGAPGDFGTVFKLTPSGSDWTRTVLHQFTGGSDGATPISNLVFDTAGNLYGTTIQGGTYNKGVVFEIAP